jgi:hypothetical protein
LNLRTKRVFRGFLELSPAEQQAFMSRLCVFLCEKAGSRLPVEQICESGVMALGPLQESDVCPCCGGRCRGFELKEGAPAPAGGWPDGVEREA